LPKKSNVSRNALNLFQPPSALMTAVVNCSALRACGVLMRACSPSFEMMSAPKYFTHSGKPKPESIFGSKPMRVRLPLESNFVSFFAVARSFGRFVICAALIGTPADLNALWFTIIVTWFVNSGRP